MTKSTESKKISLETLITKLENQNPENFKRNDIIRSRAYQDKTGEYKETFYTWKGYSTNINNFKISLEKGSALYDDKGRQPLGFRVRVLDRKRVIKSFKRNELENLYKVISTKVEKYEAKKRKEELKLFEEIMGKLTPKTPKHWKRATERTETIDRRLRNTGFFNSIEAYSTKIEDLEVLLIKRNDQIGDMMGGMLMPHPYSEPVITYKMKVLKNGRSIKDFEGEDYTLFIKSSIEILRDYHLSRN